MNAPTFALEHAAGDRHRLVWLERELSLIRQKGVDLCVWRRGLDLQLAEWCQTLARTHEIDLDEERGLERLPVCELLASLPAVPERDLLCEDIAERARTFGRLLGCKRVRLQLHAVHHQHCPRFHIDSVGVRLICTYAGPATEWIAETELERARVGRGAPSDVPSQEQASRRLERFDVALMKGRSWRGNRLFGVVHRSPAPEAQPRLVLTIDARP